MYPPAPLESALARIFAVQRQIRDLHPAFAQVYPVALAVDGRFDVYAPDPAAGRFTLAGQVPAGMPVPDGVRAAFPLDPFGFVCVVTGEVFDEAHGYATIFHEFVHCYQGTTCERDLRQSLALARESEAAGDFMWELQHPFPYGEAGFADAYAAWLDALESGDDAAVSAARSRVRTALAARDYEYLVWQEWKEGTARYLENASRGRLGLDANHGGTQPPFSRVTFYAGGDRFIRWLTARDPALAADLPRLFAAIRHFAEPAA
jgi:hypothetical protein